MNRYRRLAALAVAAAGAALGVAGCTSSYPQLATCNDAGPGYVSYNEGNGIIVKQVTDAVDCVNNGGSDISVLVTYPNGVKIEIRGEFGFTRNKPGSSR